jgi:cell division septum initiation protein DivIVA
MMITTTIQRIHDAGACLPRYQYLLKNIGVSDHSEVIDALQVLRCNGVEDTLWLLRSTACFEDTAQAWAEYNKVKAPAWAEYNKVKAPAWAEYNKVTAQAWAEYDKVTAQARAEYDKVKAQARAEYDKVKAQAMAEYDKVKAQAWAEYNKVKAPALENILS